MGFENEMRDSRKQGEKNETRERYQRRESEREKRSGLNERKYVCFFLF